MKSLLKRLIPASQYRRAYDVYLSTRYAALLPLVVGRGCECPFCGGRFRRFLPRGTDLPVHRDQRIIGAGYRAHSRCPRCDSYDRERLVYLYLTEKTRLFSAAHRLLHVAPERNLQRVLHARPGIEYLSVDLTSPLAQVKMDIRHIAYPPDTFDAIVCNHVLQEVPEDRQAMGELYRVLKPGGWAILQVPLSQVREHTLEDPTVQAPEDRARTFGGLYYVRLYGRDYIARLRSVGFSVHTYTYVAEHGVAAAQRYGLLLDEELYVATKPMSAH